MKLYRLRRACPVRWGAKRAGTPRLPGHFRNRPALYGARHKADVGSGTVRPNRHEQMRPGNPNNRRQRGRPNNNRRPNHSRNQTFDSNGPGVRIRGNAAQIYDKYIAMARDASSSGDRVLAENLLQHAEHYFRILNADNEQAAERRRMMALEEEQEFESAYTQDTSGRGNSAQSDQDEDDQDSGEQDNGSDEEGEDDVSSMPGFLTQSEAPAPAPSPAPSRGRGRQPKAAPAAAAPAEPEAASEGGEEQEPRRRGRPLGSRRRRRPADDSAELPLSEGNAKDDQAAE